jgi:hypothetical protein
LSAPSKLSSAASYTGTIGGRTIVDDLGEATYAQMIHPGDEIHLGAGQPLRVLLVVPFEAEDESPFVGVLQVEAA